MTGVNRPRVYFSIRTQFENVGDALINRELVRLVARHADAIVDVSRCPASFRRTLGLDRISGVVVVRSTLRLFASLAASRARGRVVYYFLSPGGYFGELTTRAMLAHGLKTAALALLAASGVRVCMIGVSYDRIGARHAALLRARARVLFRHVVRDEGSFELAKALSVRIDGRMPDLAFGAHPECGRMTGRDRRPRIAFSFRADQLRDQAQECERLAVTIVRGLGAAYEYSVVSQVTRDVEPATHLRDRLSGQSPSEVTFVRCDTNFDDCITAYGVCQYVISNRLHALLAGALCGAIPVPVIDPEANAKVAGWARASAIPQNVFSVREEDAAEKIVQAILRGELKRVDTGRYFHELEEAVAGIFPPSDSGVRSAAWRRRTQL